MCWAVHMFAVERGGGVISGEVAAAVGSFQVPEGAHELQLLLGCSSELGVSASSPAILLGLLPPLRRELGGPCCTSDDAPSVSWCG
jgi:hypothetical protein